MTHTVNFLAKIQQSKLGEQSNDPLGYLFKADKNYSMLTHLKCDFMFWGSASSSVKRGWTTPKILFSLEDLPDGVPVHTSQVLALNILSPLKLSFLATLKFFKS